MRSTTNAVPNNLWREEVLKEFEIGAKDRVRPIDVIGGEFYEEVTSEGARILTDQYGNEILRNFNSGIVIGQIWIYLRKKKHLHAFSYKDGKLQKRSIIIKNYDVNFTEDGKISLILDNKIVKTLDEDLTRPMNE